jgi:hypothetical protein
LAGQPLVGPCLIVGEGEDEESFFLHLLQHRDIAGFDVRHTKGNTRIGEFLEGARILPGFGFLESLSLQITMMIQAVHLIMSKIKLFRWVAMQYPVSRLKLPAAMVLPTWSL